MRHGKEERMFRLEFISNSQFLPTEIQKGKSSAEEARISLPTEDFVQGKVEEIKKAMDYEFTSSYVDHIIQKKEKFRINPVNYAMQKARLLKER